MNLFKDVRTGKASVKQRPSQLMLTCLASDHAFVVNPTFLAHPWNGTNKQNTTISKKTQYMRDPGCGNSPTCPVELSLLSCRWDLWTL